jgi:AAA15 family ATPase/GTPase
MRLKDFQVTTFQSAIDSGLVEVDDITCLVGKNEAGKTSLLKALYRLNPIRSEDANFSVTDDYPRAEVSDYEDEVARGNRTEI